jgi:hypothetical protein
MQRENSEAVWQEKGIKRVWGYGGTDVLPSVLSGQKGKKVAARFFETLIPLYKTT